MTNLGRQFSGPQYEQLSLPEMGRGTEQMRLFDTHRAGPANVYARNPSLDASSWRDEDKQVELTEDEQQIFDPKRDDYDDLTPEGMEGEFFNFESPPRSSEREYLAHQDAFRRTIRDTEMSGTHLGHDAYPQQVNPGLTFDDLQEEVGDYDQRVWSTPEGTQVGRIEFHEDDWGPNVDHAEVNPMYRGRGFSRDALVKVAGGLGPGEGIMHAGGFTHAGSQAFQAKGIPTESDLDSGFYDFMDQRRSEAIDEDEVRYYASEMYPEEDDDFWESEGAYGYLDSARQELESQFEESEPELRAEFRENLESLQAHHLSTLPQGKNRRSAFVEGWKPKGPTSGVQEELKGLPPRLA